MTDRQDIQIQFGNAMGEPLTGPHDECGLVIPSYGEEYVSPGKLKKSNACCKKQYWSE